MTILKRLYSSIILLIIGGLIIKSRLIIGDDCMGMIEGLSFLFFIIIYIVTFILVLVVPFIKKRPFNFYPLVTTILVIVGIFISFNIDKFESPTTLYATTTSPSRRHSQCSLTLRKNQTFNIKMQEIEWACFYKGVYTIWGDTLKLLRQDIEIKTNNVFTDKYFIDKNKKTLFPLDNLQDTTRWLTIMND